MSAPTQVEKRLLHHMGKAIADYDMLQNGDRVMVCLSGGKDSYTMLHLLHKLRLRSGKDFEIFAFTLDQNQPGWDDQHLRAWLEHKGYPYEILKRDTYSIVIDKIPEGKTYCSLCSRLRRGNIYGYAERNGFNKIALGHHRDDLIESLLMSIMYSGRISSMPPKLLTDNKKHIVIRPMAYCHEQDIEKFARQQEFPIIPLQPVWFTGKHDAKKIKQLIHELGAENPKVPGNILAAMENVKPSQLMSHELWDFQNLEAQLEPMDRESPSNEDSLPWSVNA